MTEEDPITETTFLFRGEEYTLREMSWPMAQLSRPLFADLSRLIASAFNSRIFRSAAGTETENIKSPDGNTVEVFKTTPLEPSAMRLMIEEQRALGTDLVDFLFLKKNSDAIVKLIIDGCPELVQGMKPEEVIDDNGHVTDKALKAFSRGLRMNEVLVLIPELLRVNASQFGARGKGMLERVKQKMEDLFEENKKTTTTSEPTSEDELFSFDPQDFRGE